MSAFYKSLRITPIIAMLFISTACDFCVDGQGGYVMEESDIYFTSKPVNSHETGIFRISKDGKGLKEIVRNAEIYSSPSKTTKKIVYTSFQAPNVKYIFKANIDGTSSEVLKNEKFSNDKLYPIISSNGKHIVVNDVSNGLWLIREDNSVLKISDKLCMNTIPSFSPDGTKLAYYEGYELYNPLSVVILDMEQDPPVLIARKEHNEGLEKYSDNALVGWSPDGQKVCYIISKSLASDYLFVGDYNNPNDKAYEITSIGAYQPAINSTLDKVVFAARDGNLWIRNLSDTAAKKYVKLTSSGRVSKSLYPEWSEDGTKILYVKQFKDESDIMTSSLEIIDLKEEKLVSRVLSNNVYKGYWNKK